MFKNEMCGSKPIKILTYQVLAVSRVNVGPSANFRTTGRKSDAAGSGGHFRD